MTRAVEAEPGGFLKLVDPLIVDPLLASAPPRCEVFAEKTIPNSHRIAPPLGVVMVAGGVVLLATSLLGGMVPM